MKKLFIFPLLFITVLGYPQNDPNSNSTLKTYKKRVLENTEIDILSSYYTQDGENAAVTGGIGSEKLNDFATNINISIPLNDDDILSIDGTVSAYTSASSSNLNPFPDEEDIYRTSNITGTPWVESTGASRQDVWTSGNIEYSHSSDNRNKIWSANLNLANEYDYFSFGFGGSFSKLFNQKNTELTLKTNIYLDTWLPVYPVEINQYANGSLNSGFFRNLNILDSSGKPIDKNSANSWRPIHSTLIQNKGRNTWSFSLSFSQILSQRAQISLFSDIVLQKGWLANPMQRVYFADKNNFYVGNPSSIPIYNSPSNKDVFQLADDIERLPNNRFKLPIGLRFNYYFNESLVLRTYYRFYVDNWGVFSHTGNIELPIKITTKFTIYPSYRYYIQTAAKYFAPFEQHLSTEKYYTSDFDLSKFLSSEVGFGIKYTDILTQARVWKFGLKTLSLDYAYYYRNIGFKSSIITFGAKFILDM
ncbi:MAG: DUF3570 domain-containing protein [Draconibacterium sp.]|nr:DUF3570 domain-containing protein [Draconibacterium sp.]